MGLTLADLPLPDAVLFDLDGTLVDTVETRIAGVARGARHVRVPDDPGRGRAAHRRGRQATGPGGRRPGRVVLDEDGAEAADRLHGEVYSRMNRDPRPLPGVSALAAAIEARGIHWAIATSSRKEQVAASVDALGLDHQPAITDASHVKQAKPAPDCCSGPPRTSASSRPAAGTSATPRGTWSRPSRPGMIPIGVTAGAAIDAAALRGSGRAVVIETLEELAATLRDR
jgi:phosphoglycolate phosphatase-like HAD superfamily hydrolase